MTIATGFTTRTPLNEAVMDMRISFGTMKPKLVVYFASPGYDLPELVKSMRTEIGTSDIIGCTSAGEMVSGRIQQDGIAGIAFDEEVVEDVAVQVIEDLSSAGMNTALEGIRDHFGVAVKDMDPSEYFGLLLTSGASGDVEIGLPDMQFISGIAAGAGDEGPRIFAGDTIYTDSAVLVMVKPKARFKAYTTPGLAAEKGDIIAETEKILEQAENEIGNPGGVISFHRAGKPRISEDEDPAQDYADLFTDIPAAGLFTSAVPSEETAALPSFMLVLEKPKRKTFLDDL